MTDCSISLEKDKRPYKESSIGLSQYQTPIIASIKSAKSGMDTSTKSNVFEAEDPNFDVMHVSRSNLRSSKAFEPQCHSGVSQNSLANPDVEDTYDWGTDYFGLCSSLLPSSFPKCNTDKWSDPALKHDLTLPIELADDFPDQRGDHLSDLFPTNSGLNPAPPSSKGALQEIEPCSRHRRSCMVAALRVLQTLHTTPSTCSSAGAESPNLNSSQPRTTGSVLSTNREVIGLISNMLKCTCFASLQLQLILTVICGKLTVWYRAMIPNTYGSLDDPITSLEDNAERVVHQPITVGEYAMDNTLEQRVRAEVVFSELQHVEALIKDLARRLQERRHDGLWNAAAMSGRIGPISATKPVEPNETAAAGAIHKCLTEFLQKQLQVAKAGIDAIVNRRHEPMDL